MSYLANGRENVRIPTFSGKEKSKEMPNSGGEPAPAERLNWLMHLQRVRGETGACKELIKSEIKRSAGKNEFAYFAQGAILREEGRIQEALDSFQTCMKLNPENADNVKEVAKCLYEMRRFRLSLEAYLEAERACKSPDWQIYYSIGQCLIRLGDTAKAKEYAEKAVHLGKHEIAYALLIKILSGEDDQTEAASVCKSGVESCPDSVNLLAELGLLYLKMGQTQLAYERLSAALALDPNCAKALLGLGCITQTYEDGDVALTKYKAAMAQDLNSVALWNNIGLCFHSKQKHVAAISCLKRALWMSPMNWRVLFNLGLVHLSTFQPASAFNFLCAAVNLRPDVAQSFAVLGCRFIGALIELKDTENAARAFKQALLLSPEDPVFAINTAMCAAIMGASEEAFCLLRRFKSLQEEHVSIPPEAVVLANNLSTALNSTENTGNSQDVEHESGSSENKELFDDGTRGISGNSITASDGSFSGEQTSLRKFEPDEV